MFNFIYYGNHDTWEFFGSSAGVPHIDLTNEGIKKYILPKIKENGYTQVVSMEYIYANDFKKQFLKMKKEDGVQVCEVKERYEEEGYTITYLIFIKNMGYDEEFNEQYLELEIFAFQDFHNIDTPADLPF